MKVCVIGLGYIGLPTSLLLANAGHEVIGVDINTKIIETLKKNQLPFIEPGLEELFQKAHKNFKAQGSIEASDAYIIAVPTPVENGLKIADLEAVKNASYAIQQVIQDGQIVILESTVPPGTSEQLILPILRQNGVKTIYFVHCPERAIPGKTLYEMIHNNRVIGGVDKASSEKVKNLYASFVQGDMFLTDVKTAEFVKLMENTFRDINIALANEFALLAEEANINVWKAIELANKHPRVNILKPGPGVGGHCIAIDPMFLAEKSSNAKIIPLARQINSGMPIYVIKMIKRMIKEVKNPTITLLGIAYKGNVDDTRESPSFKIKRIAENEGIVVKLFDPFVHEYPGNAASVEEAAKDSDCLVLVTDHDMFSRIDPKKLSPRHKNMIDTRNILDHGLWKKNGYQVNVLGDGTS